MPALLNIKTAIRNRSLAILLTVFMSSNALAAGIDVRHADTIQHYNEISLSAQLDFELSEEAIKALEHGVALDIVIETEVIEQRRWLWDRTLAEYKERYSIERQALSKQYVVIHKQQQRAFLSLDEALQYIGTIRDYPLLQANELETGKRYRGRLRAWLDIESLPAPMRPAAHISSQWHIASAWHEWSIES